VEQTRALAAHAEAVASGDKSKVDDITRGIEQIEALRQETINMFAEAEPISDGAQIRLNLAIKALEAQHAEIDTRHVRVGAFQTEIGVTDTALKASTIANNPIKHRGTILFDTGASKTTVGSDKLSTALDSKQAASVQLQTATKSRVLIRTTGHGTIYSMDTTGQLQAVDPDRRFIGRQATTRPPVTGSHVQCQCHGTEIYSDSHWRYDCSRQRH
jgi:hypothetical protein